MRESRLGTPAWNKGLIGAQKLTEKQKKEASERMKGENHFNYGKKGKLSKNYGLKRSKSTITKLSSSKLGEKNPNTKQYKIKTPDNKNYQVSCGIPEFLKTHNYDTKKWILYHSIRIKKEYKGWLVEIK